MQMPPGPPPPPAGLPPPPPYAPQMQAPMPYYVPAYPNAPGTFGALAPTDTKATVSLVLGIISVVSLFCYGIGFFFGVPAFILGLMSRRSIARSEGALGGGGMALAGAVTGGIGAALSLLYVGAIVGIIALSAAHRPPTHPSPPVYAPTATATGPVASFGGVHVVDLHPTGGPLRTQLGTELARAIATHEKLMVMTSAKWSKEALEISAALADDEMEDALENVTLVRIDVDEFKTELRAAKLEKPEVPWFFMIGPTLDPTDAISADEWGANDASTIAPVMRRFVEGTLTKRRVVPPKGTAL